MMIRVRRLIALPSFVSFEARVLYSPRPEAINLFGSILWLVCKARTTEVDLFTLRSQLSSIQSFGQGYTSRRWVCNKWTCRREKWRHETLTSGAWLGCQYLLVVCMSKANNWWQYSCRIRFTHHSTTKSIRGKLNIETSLGILVHDFFQQPELLHRIFLWT